MSVRAQNYQISPDAIAQQVSGETVIMDLASAVYFGLNSTGSKIWQQLESGAATSTILAMLADTFEAPHEVLATDLYELLSELENAGLITKSTPR
ncbi:MAG: PqqD family protein [Pseudomonadales bacterium]|nr:PqqD family protein [Pseudomonadales bacterium]